MRVLKCIEHLNDDVRRQLPGELPRHAVARERLLHVARPATEMEAVDVVHHEEEVGVLLAEIRDGDDARMAQHRHDARLALEHLERGFVGVLREHALDDDRLHEVGRAFHAGEVDDAHATTRDGPDDSISPEHHATYQVALIVFRS